MLLDYLKSEQEKRSFAGLAYLVAKADGSISLSDISLFKMFDFELELPNGTDKIKDKSIAELCSTFKEPLTREIIFTNLLSLAYAEKYPSTEQNSALEQVREGLCISRDEGNRQRDWMKMIQGSFFPEWCFD